MAETGASDVVQDAMFDTDNLLADLKWPDIVITPRQKRARENLSIGQKRDICLYREANPHYKQHQLKEHFREKWGINIGRSTVSDILKQKEKWLEMPKDTRDIYRLNFGRYTKLEEQLYKWTTMMKARFPTMSLTDAMIQRQARVLGMRLQVDNNFSYSSGWLQKFKKRYGMLTKGKRGSSGGIIKVMDTVNNVQSEKERSTQIELSASRNHIITDTLSCSPVESDENDAERSTNSLSLITVKQEPGVDSLSDNDAHFETNGITNKDFDLKCSEHGETNMATSHSDTFPAPPRLTINPHMVNRISDAEVVPVGVSIISDYYSGSDSSSVNFPNIELGPQQRMTGDFTPAESCPPTKRMRTVGSYTCSQLSSQFSHKSQTSVITAKEARAGIVRCIRFIERSPDLGNYLDILWDVYESLENHNDNLNSSRGQTTLDQFFKKL